MKKALVTGHSRGLGRALANQLRASGWQVLGIARTATDPDDVMLDLSDLEAVSGWLAGGELAKFLAGASELVLVNNAGMVAPVGLVGRLDADAIAKTVRLNVTAPLVLTDAVLRLRGNTPVQIMHISSGAARRGYPGWSTYCATKAALDLHAQALASEKQAGVRVVSVAPGVVDTDMQAEIRSSQEFPLRERFAAMKEAGQLASPDEAASQLVALLESSTFGEVVVTDIRG